MKLNYSAFLLMRWRQTWRKHTRTTSQVSYSIEREKETFRLMHSTPIVTDTERENVALSFIKYNDL